MILREPIRVDEFLSGAFDDKHGAVVVFTGVVRSQNDGREVKMIHYDAYPPLAEREIARVVAEAERAHAPCSARVAHRVGDVSAGEVSLIVVVRAPHRERAYAASQSIVDELKRRAPIWKKEFYADGTARWL
jgi:molybdopterin synthase catalytic subunit